MNMLEKLSLENVEEVAVGILYSNLKNDYTALAQQIVPKALKSPAEAEMCSLLSVALMERICEPGTCHQGVGEPLGGSTGPGKAFRLSLVEKCIEAFEQATTNIDHHFALPTHHQLFLQAKSRVMAVSHVLCHFVNWKLLRDTALNHCLKHLLDRKLSDACIEVAAEILLAVDPWMQENWGYTSRRYLDAYYMRIRSYCAHQIALSMTPEGRWLDLAFHRDVMETFVKPRMQWVHAQREKMMLALSLPAVDVAASEALGRSRAMSDMASIASSDSLQSVEQMNKPERDYTPGPYTHAMHLYHPQPTSTQVSADASMKTGSMSSSSASALSLYAPRTLASLDIDQGMPHRASSSKESLSNSGDSCTSNYEAESVQPRLELRTPDIEAQLDTFSSNPHHQNLECDPRSAPDSETPSTLEACPLGGPVCLTEAVGRSLQEFMLTHDSTEFTCDMQALLRGCNEASLLEALLLCASAKLEQVSWTQPPLSTPHPHPRSRKGLRRHMEQQRDRLFCRGGTIDPQALDPQQYPPPRALRSRAGMPIHRSNPGHKIMLKWGWQEGQGLGANLQGRTEPYCPPFQPLDEDHAKQGLGEARYKGMLKGDAAADQLRGLMALMCSGLLRAAVGEGFQAFLFNTAPPSGSRVHPLRIRALCWVGTVLATLLSQGAMSQRQAFIIVNWGVRASARPGSTTAKQLARSIWAAADKQQAAIRQAELQAEQAKQKQARQMAALDQPQAASKKTTYITGPGGRTVRVKVKQYGVSTSAAPASNGRVSWE